MKNIVIFGYGYQGIQAYQWLRRQKEYHFCGFADNSIYKQGRYVGGKKIVSMDELKEMNADLSVSVIIAAYRWWEIARQCKVCGISVEGIYDDNTIKKAVYMDFEQLDLSQEIKLYAGDIADEVHMGEDNLYGLSITKADEKHIYHNIMNAYPLPEGCISRFEVEEVLECLPRESQINILNEIYRVMKAGSVCRITVTDYNSPYAKNRIMTDSEGNILFDAGGGGNYGKDGIEGGIVYFPTYEDFKEILEQTEFTSFDWLCYHTKDGELHKKFIDMSRGYNRRVTNETDEDVYCIVVDCFK